MLDGLVSTYICTGYSTKPTCTIASFLCSPLEPFIWLHISQKHTISLQNWVGTIEVQQSGLVMAVPTLLTGITNNAVPLHVVC